MNSYLAIRDSSTGEWLTGTYKYPCFSDFNPRLWLKSDARSMKVTLTRLSRGSAYYWKGDPKNLEVVELELTEVGVVKV